ncbi:MAG: hypothetical protein V4617_17985 [Gemmatimonadota bacterium]
MRTSAAVAPLRAALWAVLSLSVIACNPSEPVGSATVTGAYTLRSINGAPLPYTSTAAGVQTVFLDDVFNLYQGGTYAQTGHTRTTVNGVVTDAAPTATGTYSMLGTSLSLTVNGQQGLRIAIMNGRTMTIVEAGFTYVYRK